MTRRTYQGGPPVGTPENDAAVARLRAEAVPMTRPRHMSDGDCTLGDDDCCTGCGVYHGDPCPECEGCGFHTATCEADRQ